MIPNWAIRTAADRKAIEEGCYWDEQKAAHVVKFTETFFRSQFVHGRLTLQEQQRRFLKSLYGWRLKDGRRRFRFANLHVPKKSFGKTLLVSVLAFYEMLASGEPSPVIISAAASLPNASQVYDEVAYAVKNSPFHRFAHLIPYQKKIKFNTLNSSFSSIASDGKKQHGTHASLVILDEAAVAPQHLYDALRWAIAARPNGLVICISTAQSDQNHWYYQQVYSKSKRVLSGEDTDISHYAQVHEADPDGNPESPEQWKKANPLLGASWADAEQFARDCASAKAGGIGEWLNFRRLRLNQWVKAEELAWLDVSDWDKHEYTPTEDELKRCEAVIGYDGSETTDPSSCSICFRLPGDRFFFRSWAWVAEEGVKLREAVNLPKYEQFAAEGSMTITKGNLIDYPLVRDHLLKLCQSYDVRMVHADPRSAYTMLHEIKEHGYNAEHVPQSFRYYNGLMKEFARAYAEGRILHDGNSWLRYCLSNIRCEVNRYDEIRPVRSKCTDKIDAGISALCAFLGLLNKPAGSGGILWI